MGRGGGDDGDGDGLRGGALGGDSGQRGDYFPALNGPLWSAATRPVLQRGRSTLRGRRRPVECIRKPVARDAFK